MLKFVNVSKRFLGQLALDQINLDIDKGEIVLIKGPSGSGKTTLLKLLLKEHNPDEGEIWWQDVPLQKIKGSKIPQHRRKIGAVFQDYKLLPEMNVWENIALALSILGKSDKEIAQRVTDLLNLVGLPEKAYHFPHQLSGGEAQRIAIARALSTGPELIFADEPTGNLDAKTATSIAKLLQKINQLGTTVLITSHDEVIEKLLQAARQVELDKGKLVKDTGVKKQKKNKV